MGGGNIHVMDGINPEDDDAFSDYSGSGSSASGSYDSDDSGSLVDDFGAPAPPPQNMPPMRGPGMPPQMRGPMPPQQPMHRPQQRNDGGNAGTPGFFKIN